MARPKRNPEEFLFCDPSELTGDEGQNDKDVEVALVVGHEDLRLGREDVFQAHGLDADTGQPQDDRRPDPGNLVDGVFPGPKEGQEDHHDGKKGRNENGGGNEKR
jgi:hypothetical protein